MLLNLLKARSLTRSACLLLILALPFFFVGGPDSHSTPLFHALWDCGHIVFFTVLVFALHRVVDFSRVRAGVALTLVVVVSGGIIEIVQAYTGRDGNWQDLLRDLVGTWIGLFWLQKSSYQVWLGRLFVSVLLVPSVVPVYAAAQSQRHTEQQFPLLADFETEIDLFSARGSIERSSSYYSHGDYSLKVHLTTEKYSNLTFVNFFNSWQGYNNLSLDIYNPDAEPLDLTLRIDDLQHLASDNQTTDRFNQRLHLQPGWNAISIPVADIQRAPVTRLLQLDKINSIIIFASQLPRERDIYLDNLRLQ